MKLFEVDKDWRAGTIDPHHMTHKEMIVQWEQVSQSDGDRYNLNSCKWTDRLRSKRQGHEVFWVSTIVHEIPRCQDWLDKKRETAIN